jgi:uncharacterized GH25 family protein
MHRSGQKFRFAGLSAILIFLAFVVPANAHFMWINVGDYTPPQPGGINLNIGWGHSFANPVGNVLQDLDRLDKIVLLGPNGAELPVKPSDGVDFKVEKPLDAEGSYLVVANRKEGFFSKTTQGYKSQSKKGLKDVIQCSYSGGYSKAIINVGHGGGDAFSKTVGHTLEIVPLSDPAGLKQGDYFTCKVLYAGKPASLEIYAAYAGFSTEGAWAYVSKTNKDGMGRIKILQPGIWLLKVSHQVPYDDPKECDQYSYTSTLTFEVK